jgi:chemotaxis-related protein WspB
MLLLLFKIAETRYGIDAREVLEVRSDTALRPLPGSPRGVIGLLMLRGDPVPVIDVSLVISDSPARNRRSTRILIVATDHKTLVGLRVEGAIDAVRVDDSKFAEVGLAVPGAPCLGPVASLDDGLVQKVIPSSLFSPDIRSSIDLARVTAGGGS